MPKYYLIDSQKNTCKGFETRLELLKEYFRFDPQKRFHLLNVTGKDTLREMVPTGQYICYPRLMTSFPEYRWESRLRRFRVLDGEGRSIDIRSWEELYQEEVKGSCPIRETQTRSPKFRQEPCGSGAKQHEHYFRGAAFWKESLKAAMDDDFMDDVDYLPITNHGKARKRGITSWSSNEKANRKARNRYSGSASWKDQSKAGKQWAKHKPGATRAALEKGCPWKRSDEAELDLDALRAELCSSRTEEPVTTVEKATPVPPVSAPDAPLAYGVQFILAPSASGFYFRDPSGDESYIPLMDQESAFNRILDIIDNGHIVKLEGFTLSGIYAAICAARQDVARQIEDLVHKLQIGA